MHSTFLLDTATSTSRGLPQAASAHLFYVLCVLTCSHNSSSRWSMLLSLQQPQQPCAGEYQAQACLHQCFVPCSLLRLAPDIISLPTDGLAATASQADVSAGEAGAEGGEQDSAARGRSSGDSTGGANQAAAGPKDLLVGHRCVVTQLASTQHSHLAAAWWES
jgi:hypothetical protein